MSDLVMVQNEHHESEAAYSLGLIRKMKQHQSKLEMIIGITDECNNISQKDDAILFIANRVKIQQYKP